jgi:hypothetical protein
MPDQLIQSDHDILNTLVANMANMKESQEKFHLEMKESFSDLKYNLADRLSKVENGLTNTDKVFIAKAEQDRRDIEFNKRLVKLEVFQQRIIGALIILNVLLGAVIVYLTSKH